MTILTDFQARLFSQFDNSAHIQAMVEILSDALQDTVDACDYILDHSSIDTAEGELLEYLGEKIGVRRPRAQETKIFTLCRLGEVQHPDMGFSDDENPGGYLTTQEGLEDQSDPDSVMTNVDYRYLIKQKAASYRKKMTREILFEYLIAFGCQCKIEDEETLSVWIDPVRYSDFDQWTRNYIETRGFKPAGISVRFRDTSRHEDTI